jgi:hypothetical protein
MSRWIPNVLVCLCVGAALLGFGLAVLGAIAANYREDHPDATVDYVLDVWAAPTRLTVYKLEFDGRIYLVNSHGGIVEHRPGQP